MILIGIITIVVVVVVVIVLVIAICDGRRRLRRRRASRPRVDPEYHNKNERWARTPIVASRLVATKGTDRSVSSSYTIGSSRWSVEAIVIILVSIRVVVGIILVSSSSSSSSMPWPSTHTHTLMHSIVCNSFHSTAS